jgi:hypothetical protein
MKVKWYEKAEGQTSAMRIIAMICAVTGCIAVLAGVGAMFLKIPECVAIAGAGAGMAGLGEVSKAIQALGENK